MADRHSVRLLLVDRDDLTGRTTWADCIMCGCPEMHAITDSSERVWDSDPAACAACGAIDHWTVDEDVAQLAGRPDDTDHPVEVLRSVWETTGRDEWLDRARGVDAEHWTYIVVDGDREYQLLEVTDEAHP